ncbi:MarR family winged helix-turn-helix transcriptional regulator [Rhodococcus artemisiae]|uniref:MarR family transcriptional regulator n=1 Tax=Rhodococcus artemisiae TaxID=714159 RepID=A0ABU7L6F8_9NOCA|nr:MarR family transcriptional regulator [Rhodococcus artemisiae]MEE2057122.1 MarR family transcriptional regulator [Rhodococcus artemisiae]
MHNPADLSRALIDAAFELRRALREYMVTSGEDETLPEAQSEVLHDVANNPGTRIGEVARRLSLRPNTVSTLVRHLEDKGLLERRPDPADGRVSTLTISGERTARRDRRAERRVSALADEVDMLPSEDLRRLTDALPVLARLNVSLRTHSPIAQRRT